MTKWIVNVDGVGYEVEAAGVMSALAMVLGAHSRTNDRDIAEIVMIQETALAGRVESHKTNATSELGPQETKAQEQKSDAALPTEATKTLPTSSTNPASNLSNEPESTPASNPSPKSKPRRSRSRRSRPQS